MTFESEVETLRGKNTDEWTDEDSKLLDKVMELREIQKNAKLKAIQEFYIQKERIKIKLKENELIFSKDYEEMEELTAKLKESKKDHDPKYALFITINPAVNDTSVYQELDKKVKKCLSKYWITDYCYCYEQRSDDAKSIHGFHCHILLTRGAHKPSHCEREIRSTFGSLVGIPSKHINIQYKRKDWISDKISYMLGNKTGDGKDKKSEVDKIMRKNLGIEEIYRSGYDNYFLNYSTHAQRSEVLQKA